MCTPSTRSDLKVSCSCSGQFTLQDLHLSGIVVHLLKGNTTENSGWKFSTPKLTINFGLAALSKIASSHSEQQTQLYDHPLRLSTAPLFHIETFATSLSSPAKQRPKALSGVTPPHAQQELLPAETLSDQ